MKNIYPLRWHEIREFSYYVSKEKCNFKSRSLLLLLDTLKSHVFFIQKGLNCQNSYHSNKLIFLIIENDGIEF